MHYHNDLTRTTDLKFYIELTVGKLKLHLIAITKIAKNRMPWFCMKEFVVSQFSRRNLTHSEFLFETAESENRRVKSFPQEYQNTFTIVQRSMVVKNVVSPL